MKNKVKLTFEFPEEQYPYLKMLCARERISIKEFASAAIIKAIEDYEDSILRERASDILKKIESGEESTTTLEDFEKEMNE